MSNNEIYKRKNEIRKKFIKLRDELDRNNAKKFSNLISNKIINSLYFQNAKNILVYIPSRSEVDIRKVIEKAWYLNKNVLVPKTDSTTKQMCFYRIGSWEELEIGNFGILEPVIHKKKPFPITDIEVVLIPGVVFDYNGYRIGYGGGYYDRFLVKCNTSLYKIGVAFNFQVVKDLPILDHDYALDKIVTDEQTLFIQI